MLSAILYYIKFWLKSSIYRSNLKNRIFGGFKALQFTYLKRLNIINIKSLKIGEFQQL